MVGYDWEGVDVRPRVRGVEQEATNCQLGSFYGTLAMLTIK